MRLSEFQNTNLSKNKEFERWFYGSHVIDASGNPLKVFHSSNSSINKFDSGLTKDGGIHFGTSPQANMRNRKGNLTPVYLRILKMRRMKDYGGGWAKKIKAAKSSGFDGIVYLNRYEGIELEDYPKNSTADSLQAISDSKFKQLIPIAEDSYIVFSGEQVWPVYATHPDK